MEAIKVYYSGKSKLGRLEEAVCSNMSGLSGEAEIKAAQAELNKGDQAFIAEMQAQRAQGQTPTQPRTGYYENRYYSGPGGTQEWYAREVQDLNNRLQRGDLSYSQFQWYMGEAANKAFPGAGYNEPPVKKAEPTLDPETLYPGEGEQELSQQEREAVADAEVQAARARVEAARVEREELRIVEKPGWTPAGSPEEGVVSGKGGMSRSQKQEEEIPKQAMQARVPAVSMQEIIGPTPADKARADAQDKAQRAADFKEAQIARLHEQHPEMLFPGEGDPAHPPAPVPPDKVPVKVPPKKKKQEGVAKEFKVADAKPPSMEDVAASELKTAKNWGVQVFGTGMPSQLSREQRVGPSLPAISMNKLFPQGVPAWVKAPDPTPGSRGGVQIRGSASVGTPYQASAPYMPVLDAGGGVKVVGGVVQQKVVKPKPKTWAEQMASRPVAPATPVHPVYTRPAFVSAPASERPSSTSFRFGFLK